MMSMKISALFIAILTSVIVSLENCIAPVYVFRSPHIGVSFVSVCSALVIMVSCPSFSQPMLAPFIGGVSGFHGRKIVGYISRQLLDSLHTVASFFGCVLTLRRAKPFYISSPHGKFLTAMWATPSFSGNEIALVGTINALTYRVQILTYCKLFAATLASIYNRLHLLSNEKCPPVRGTSTKRQADLILSQTQLLVPIALDSLIISQRQNRCAND
jgi:hypothetical protein